MAEKAVAVVHCMLLIEFFSNSADLRIKELVVALIITDYICLPNMSFGKQEIAKQVGFVLTVFFLVNWNLTSFILIGLFQVVATRVMTSSFRPTQNSISGYGESYDLPLSTLG